MRRCGRAEVGLEGKASSGSDGMDAVSGKETVGIMGIVRDRRYAEVSGVVAESASEGGIADEGVLGTLSNAVLGSLPESQEGS